ncbi:hypothetical protein AC1031_008075 [Aphanomyces cochlioides]|nr:hypothetical protein AC1031_008075 [Aphanomyces cochlioides]
MNVSTINQVHTIMSKSEAQATTGDGVKRNLKRELMSPELNSSKFRRSADRKVAIFPRYLKDKPPSLSASQISLDNLMTCSVQSSGQLKDTPWMLRQETIRRDEGKRVDSDISSSRSSVFSLSSSCQVKKTIVGDRETHISKSHRVRIQKTINTSAHANQENTRPNGMQHESMSAHQKISKQRSLGGSSMPSFDLTKNNCAQFGIERQRDLKPSLAISNVTKLQRPLPFEISSFTRESFHRRQVSSIMDAECVAQTTDNLIQQADTSISNTTSTAFSKASSETTPVVGRICFTQKQEALSLSAENEQDNFLFATPKNSENPSTSNGNTRIFIPLQKEQFLSNGIGCYEQSQSSSTYYTTDHGLQQHDNEHFAKPTRINCVPTTESLSTSECIAQNISRDGPLPQSNGSYNYKYDATSPQVAETTKLKRSSGFIQNKINSSSAATSGFSSTILARALMGCGYQEMNGVPAKMQSSEATNIKKKSEQSSSGDLIQCSPKSKISDEKCQKTNPYIEELRLCTHDKISSKSCTCNEPNKFGNKETLQATPSRLNQNSNEHLCPELFRDSVCLKSSKLSPASLPLWDGTMSQHMTGGENTIRLSFDKEYQTLMSNAQTNATSKVQDGSEQKARHSTSPRVKEGKTLLHRERQCTFSLGNDNKCARNDDNAIEVQLATVTSYHGFNEAHSSMHIAKDTPTNQICPESSEDILKDMDKPPVVHECVVAKNAKTETNRHPWRMGRRTRRILDDFEQEHGTTQAKSLATSPTTSYESLSIILWTMLRCAQI